MLTLRLINLFLVHKENFIIFHYFSPTEALSLCLSLRFVCLLVFTSLWFCKKRNSDEIIVFQLHESFVSHLTWGLIIQIYCNRLRPKCGSKSLCVFVLFVLLLPRFSLSMCCESQA